MRDLLLDAAAVARLTRLWTQDSFPPVVAAQRSTYSYLHKRHGEVWAEGLTSCPWCCSVYFAAAVVLARRVWPAGWEQAGRVLALSWAAGWVGTR